MGFRRHAEHGYPDSLPIIDKSSAAILHKTADIMGWKDQQQQKIQKKKEVNAYATV